MINKDNIFNYATRELTQDAFLRWLISNWNSKHLDVRTTSLSMIREFLGFNEGEAIDISHLETKSQETKIDILVFLTVNEVRHLIAIQDKTDSNEHDDQLFRYKESLDNRYLDHIKHFIFYKTSPMLEQEISLIKSLCWNVYDISRIYHLFSSINTTRNHYLLNSYYEYIKYLHQAYTGELSPNIEDWNLKHWQNYVAKSTLKLPENIESMIGNYRNQYIMFAYNFKNYWDKGPYLEFRSREVKNSNFSMKILTYGLDDNLVNNHINQWKEKIRESNLFQVQNHKRQIGKSIIKEHIRNIDDLEKVVIKYVEEFSRIMNI